MNTKGDTTKKQHPTYQQTYNLSRGLLCPPALSRREWRARARWLPSYPHARPRRLGGTPPHSRPLLAPQPPPLLELESPWPQPFDWFPDQEDLSCQSPPDQG